jgi:predicted Zn-dependent peptidase
MKHTVTKKRLKNGSSGLMIHVPGAAVMSYDFQFIAGEFLVPKKKWEVPHLMEHMLLGANEKYPRARLFQQEFEKNGAYYNASTGAYGIDYTSECADFEWERIAELLLLAITKPIFLESEFKGEFGNVEEELISRHNNAEEDKVRVDLMQNVELKDIVSHYKKTHSAKNMRFIIAGNLTPAKEQKILDMIEAAEFQADIDRLPLPDETPKVLSKPLCIQNDTVDNIHFYIDIVRTKPIAKPEDRFPLGAVNHLLTGTLYSRILGEARERGWAYSLGSDMSYNKDYALWWFGGQISKKNIHGIFDLVVREIQSIARGEITDEELEAAKDYALGSYQRGAQTVASVANNYGWKFYYENTVADYHNTPAYIKAVTKEKCIAMVRQMLKDNHISAGFLGACDTTLTTDLHKKALKVTQY